MVINISVQYNGGFLSDITLNSIDPRLLPLGNYCSFVFIAHVIVYYYYHV